MTQSEHVHKLRRGFYKTGTAYFKCLNCPFVVTATQAVGRINRCWRCDKPFYLTRNDIRWAKPVCSICHGTPTKSVPKSKLEDFLNEIVK